MQYGSFIGAAEPPDWSAVERDAERLLSRSMDIALLVCLCRTATRLRRAAGLADALQRLLHLLRTWPDTVHPRVVIDGIADPGVRANALAALADREGLLDDIGALLRTLQDEGRPTGAADSRAPLATAAAAVAGIDAWSREQLGDDAPSLQPLLRLLAPYARHRAEPPPAAEAPGPVPHPPPIPSIGCTASLLPGMPALPDAARPVAAPGRDREALRAVLADARDWFETHEPSSPVAILLRQAERMIGLRWNQLAQALPAEWLQKWDAPGERDGRQVAR